MAKVTLIRGQNNTIKTQNYKDGAIYLAKDKYKLYADYNNYRNELNNGICLSNITISFAKESVESIVEIKDDLIDPMDLSQPNFIVQICGKDLIYFADGVYCDSIEFDENTQINKLIFKRKEKLPNFIYSANIFIYDAVLNTHKIETTHTEEESYLVSASNWTLNNGQYSTTVNDVTLNQNQVSLITQANDTSDYYAIDNATINDSGALVLNATYQPIEDIQLYIQQLPEEITSTKIVISAQALEENELNDYTIQCDGITEDSMLLVQFLDNTKEQEAIQQIRPSDNSIIVTASYQPTQDITINVIDLKDKIKTYEKIIEPEDWTAQYNDHWYASIKLDSSLMCGIDGNLIPIISCKYNNTDFNNIYGIVINEKKDILTAHSHNKAINPITISIIDFIV